MRTRDRLERLALSSMAVACPAPEQLADYTLGLLAGNEQLRVAAHVRQCPLCQDDVAISRPPAPQPGRLRTLIARALPAAVGAGRRGGRQSEVRRFVSADLLVELTIAPPSEDVWRITGQVLRTDIAQPDLPVTLRTQGRRYQQTTDADGFFVFTGLAAGTYRLSVRAGSVRVQIDDLVLEAA